MKYSLATLAVASALFDATLAFQQPHPRRWPRPRVGSIRGSVGNDENSLVDPTGGSVAATAAAALPTLASETHPATPLPANPVGVIFDMDGTLVKHAIDFADMRRRVYAVADADPIGRALERDCVLTLASKLSPKGAEACAAIFADVERRALEDMAPAEGGVDLLRFLGDRGLRRAVLTRNLERNVAVMADLYREEMECDSEEPIFHPIVARDTPSRADDCPIPAKPRPDGILHVCDVWGCDPSDVIMMGDSANDDVTAANRAGCGGAVLLTQPGGTELDTDSGYAVGESAEEVRERTPGLRVESLAELQICLETLLGERDVGDGDRRNIFEGPSTSTLPLV